MGKIFEAEEFSEDSLLAAKTTEDLDFTKSINQELSIPDQEQFQHLLRANTKCFVASDCDLGSSNHVQHGIDIGDNLPTHQQTYASAWKQQDIMKKQVGNMLRDDVIKPKGLISNHQQRLNQ